MPDVEELAADPRLVAALAAARCVRFDEPGALYAISDMEVANVVRARGADFVLGVQSRSSAEREVCRTDDLELIFDYLRFELRSSVHLVHRGDILPPGFEIESDPGTLTLVGPDNGWRLTVPDGIGARRGLIAFAIEGRNR
ncbi:hypothetical protein FLP10_12445 [Agromyces intestinalis]|uniref:Uncharacterized protein n=1 Tax=Agromyces intestinalis TaxID=2592652 RepID=A0A5C1YJX4_9MICO|nr:hypothetical protein [Agromyces intestinalis]QEO15132.1 hypothetical protein FLP10_12445 [Agromyces intestinalis]